MLLLPFSPRSGRQHKDFHPSRDARPGTPAWGVTRSEPRAVATGLVRTCGAGDGVKPRALAPGSKPSVKIQPAKRGQRIWSALTCQRLGKRRPAGSPARQPRWGALVAALQICRPLRGLGSFSTLTLGLTPQGGVPSRASRLAAGFGLGRIYLVEPTGPIEDDPDLTNKKFRGNPTKAYRSLEPLRVTGEITDWQGHSPEKQKAMKDALEQLERRGVEAIED